MKEMVYFDYSGHLNDETIAMYAKSIVSNEQSTMLPRSVEEHFEECEACKTEIFDFAEVITGNYDCQNRNSQRNNNQVKDEIEKHSSSKIHRFILSRRFTITSIAALFIIMTAVSWCIFRPVTPEKLFIQYYTPYNNILTVKSAGFDIMNQGLLLYDLKMYDSATIYFRQLIKDDPDNQDARFYLANALLASGKAQESIPLFLSLQNRAGNKYEHPSRWLLGLAYLRIDNTGDATKVFQQIVDAHNFYSEKAGKILRKLR